MRQSSQRHRMGVRFGLDQPAFPRIHLLGNQPGFGRNVRRSCNAHLGGAIAASRFIVDVRQYQFVDLAHMKRTNWFRCIAQLLDIINGIAVINHFKMFTQAFPANRQACFQNQLRFAQCDRAAFNGVGVVNPLDHDLFF